VTLEMSAGETSTHKALQVAPVDVPGAQPSRIQRQNLSSKPSSRRWRFLTNLGSKLLSRSREPRFEWALSRFAAFCYLAVAAIVRPVPFRCIGLIAQVICQFGLQVRSISLLVSCLSKPFWPKMSFGSLQSCSNSSMRASCFDLALAIFASFRRVIDCQLHSYLYTLATVGDFVGLCLLIDFSDEPARSPETRSTTFATNRGIRVSQQRSVSTISAPIPSTAALYEYRNALLPGTTSQVLLYEPSTPQGVRARQLIVEALSHLQANNFDFTPLTADNAVCLRHERLLFR